LTFNKPLTFVPSRKGQALGSWGEIDDRSSTGFDIEGAANTEADHFANCRVCGARDGPAFMPRGR
jgi:hypothetical protein